MTFVFWSNRYVCWSLASWKVARHCLVMGNKEWIFSFALLSHAAFCLLNCICFDTQVFSILFSPSPFPFPPILPRRGVIEQLGRHPSSRQGQRTTGLPCLIMVFTTGCRRICSCTWSTSSPPSSLALVCAWLLLLCILTALSGYYCCFTASFFPS